MKTGTYITKRKEYDNVDMIHLTGDRVQRRSIS